MCLAVPARLIEQHGSDGLVDLHGNRLRVSTLLVPEAQVGDWLLVHAGFAIQRLDEQDAKDTFAILDQAEKAGRGVP